MARVGTYPRAIPCYNGLVGRAGAAEPRLLPWGAATAVCAAPTKRKADGMKKKKATYTEDMPHRLYTFFTTYSDIGAPSYSKFARSIGVTLEDVEKWKRHNEFERAYRECSEIRRDYLIDNALAKRFDASTVKFLLTTEYRMGEDTGDDGGGLDVRVEVIE